MVDYQFVLDIDYETALARLDGRGQKNRLDFTSEESFEARRMAYLKLAQLGESPWAGKTFLIDARGTPAQVLQSIMDHWDEETRNA